MMTGLDAIDPAGTQPFDANAGAEDMTGPGDPAMSGAVGVALA